MYTAVATRLLLFFPARSSCEQAIVAVVPNSLHHNIHVDSKLTVHPARNVPQASAFAATTAIDCLSTRAAVFTCCVHILVLTRQASARTPIILADEIMTLGPEHDTCLTQCLANDNMMPG